ncbi:MAG TPA: 2-isopropylmalate synthase [Armatimonadetes bacterium]|nr:2-isopropylmalate synthase [Armatimonadota bacterium]
MSDYVRIFDTTLRDGEQSPGASLNRPEKVEIALQLARLGVDVIEAGFPISSPGDFEAVQQIADEVRGPEICGLARVREQDVARAFEAVRSAERARIHTFIATSEIHTEKKLRKTQDEVLAMAAAAVRQARELAAGHADCTVEFSTEDGSRTDLEYLVDIISAVIEAGAQVVNVPDTVGYAIPEQYYQLIRTLHERIPSLKDVIVSVHCHDDLGLAVANSLAGVRGGARQVECTINGLGERGGNAALEEVVMALRTRADLFGVDTHINATELYRTSQMVSRLSGMVVQRNKAIVGANAFAHASGIHQDGMLKDASTYEIMRPQDVGVPTTTLSLTRRSGRHALSVRLAELGYKLEGEALNEAYERFLATADRKKEVFDEDLRELVEDQVKLHEETFELLFCQFASAMSTDAVPTASVRVQTPDGVKVRSAVGDGPIDAVYSALAKATGVKVELLDYRLQSVTGGTDAMARVTVRVAENGCRATGHGSHTDIFVASAKAYVDAVNKVVYLSGQAASTPATGQTV